jgi:hypothetical protein
VIVFTICSNNYLAQAKILGDSIIVHNPGYIFIIGLIDEFHKDIDYSFFEPHIILPVAEIGLQDLDSLWRKYNIIELNTSVKASYFKYLFKANPNVDKICYLDPDIRVYHPLDLLEKELEDNFVLLVPHINTPIELDGKSPGEHLFLQYGIYNLGFIGLHRNCSLPSGLLDWWEERTLTLGYNKPEEGLFVDQLWINFVPVFFEKVKILKHSGLNMAPWNLHERTLRAGAGLYEITDGSPLYFFHFSNYKYTDPDHIATSYKRYNFSNHSELKGIYNEYKDLLLKNNVDTYSIIPCSYVLRGNDHRRSLQPDKDITPIAEVRKGYTFKVKNIITLFLRLFGYKINETI